MCIKISPQGEGAGDEVKENQVIFEYYRLTFGAGSQLIINSIFDFQYFSNFAATYFLNIIIEYHE